MSVWEYLTTAASWQGEDGITHRLWEHVWISAASVFVACLIALPLGILLGHVGRGGGVAVNLANAGRAIPTLGIIVLFAVSPIGLNTATLIATLVIFAVPPILANAYVGVSTVDRDAKESARGMGLSGGQVLRQVEIPLALPLMAAGVRTSAVQVVATATLAGYTGFGTLGQLVFRGFVVNLSYLVIGGAVLVAILALLTEVLLGFVQRLVTPAGLRIGQRGPARDASTIAPAGREQQTAMAGSR
jgi:osmoprotectant transport system permease protein